MEQNYLTRAAKYLADLRRRKAWKKVVGGLGTAVVFCTVYALILPAITLTRPLTCQLEEHHHTEECYAAVSPISSTTQLPRQTCSLESVYAGLTPDTAHADFVLHTHDASCYLDGQVGGELICTLPEVRAHVHTEACYTTVTQLICQLDGAPDIEIPGEGGGQPVTDPDNSNTGTQEPGTGSGPDAGVQEPTAQEIYHHVDSCYENFTEPVCGLAEEPATEGHQHTEACYTREMVRSETPACGLTEEDGHVHTDECYPMVEGTNMVLACALPEAPASEGHIHSADCYRRLICGKQEGELEVVTVFPESAPPLSQGFDDAAANTENTGETVPETLPHVHNATCYIEKQVVACADDQYTPHEHSAACYNENGELICGRVVTRDHVHTAECFVTDSAAEGQPEQQPGQGEGQSTICGKQEHVHTDACYEPVQTVNREELDQAWGALIWSNTISEASETVLDAQTTVTSWVDTDALDPMGLEALRAAPAEDLTRFLNSGIGIQVEQDIYSYSKYGPMDPDAKFSILLSWDLTEANFAVPVIETQTPAVPDENSGDPALALLSAPVEAATGSTGTLLYTYTFPQQVVVEDIEKRVLTDSNSGQPVLTYCVQNNVLTVNYAAPVEHVSTSFSLLASWAEGVGDQETVNVQWSNGVFSEVTFASPELTITKTMGEDGLRVLEDGTVWADYTVTVTNSGLVAAKGITLSDTLESEYFTFARGGMEDGADYSVTRNSTQEDGEAVLGAPEYRTFENYDGGSTIAFPAFDLGAGESCVYEYKALMTAEDRAAVDEIILAEAETLPAGQRPSGVTVRNTATAICHTSKGGVEYTASSQGTYGGPDSKHVEDVTVTYSGDTFDATFTVNGDAILPPGITKERVEEIGSGNFLLKVNVFDEASEEYQAFARQLESTAEDEEETENAASAEEQLELAVMGLELRYNSMKLDLSDCEVTAVITPNAALENYHKPVVASETEDENAIVLGEEGYSVALKAFTMPEGTATDAITGETTPGEPVEEGTVSFDIVTKQADGILAVDASAEQSGETTTPEIASSEAKQITFTVPANRSMAMRSSEADFPTYTVNFCARLDRLERLAAQPTSGSFVRIIDTSKDVAGRTEAVLPKNDNSATQVVRYISVDDKGKLDTKKEMQMLFQNVKIMFNPNVEVNLGMFNILEQLAQKDLANPDGESNYTLYGFTVNYDADLSKLLDGEGGWNFGNSAYTVSGNASAYSIKQGNANGVDGKTITLEKDATVTLIFEPNTSTKTRDLAATFYDYDMTDGTVYTSENLTSSTRVERTTETGAEANIPDKNWYANTYQQGINNPANYSGSGTKYGFGNGSFGSGLENESFDGNTLNKANMKNGADVKRATFQIVQNSLSPTGKLLFSDGIIGPDLFDKGTALGKTEYSGYSLGFRRTGDTYTMAQVNGTKSEYASNLDRLWRLFKNADGTPSMRSNEFWPLDNCLSHGTEGHDLKYGRYNGRDSYSKFVSNGTTGTFPCADFSEYWKKMGRIDEFDDGNKANHNCLFGMQFKVEFTVPEGYVGPLDYCFFGDDDLWLYLEYPNGNTQLVCDIGGVHSSVGEYVNLRDYIGDKKNGAGAGGSGVYKLHLYYTERGHSGSTCWMQYTLPGLRSLPVVPDPGNGTGTLRISKEVTETSQADMSFDFALTLEKGTSQVEDGTKYNYSTYQADGSILVDQIKVGETVNFSLKAGQSIIMNGLAPGITYRVEEIDPQNAYRTVITTVRSDKSNPTVEENAEKKTTGVIEGNIAIAVTYTNSFHYSLPETGGAGRTGTIWYTYGALPMMAAAVVWYKRSRKKGGNVS